MDLIFCSVKFPSPSTPRFLQLTMFQKSSCSKSDHSWFRFILCLWPFIETMYRVGHSDVNNRYNFPPFWPTFGSVKFPITVPTGSLLRVRWSSSISVWPRACLARLPAAAWAPPRLWHLNWWVPSALAPENPQFFKELPATTATYPFCTDILSIFSCFVSIFLEKNTWKHTCAVWSNDLFFKLGIKERSYSLLEKSDSLFEQLLHGFWEVLSVSTSSRGICLQLHHNLAEVDDCTQGSIDEKARTLHLQASPGHTFA